MPPAGLFILHTVLTPDLRLPVPRCTTCNTTFWVAVAAFTRAAVRHRLYSAALPPCTAYPSLGGYYYYLGLFDVGIMQFRLDVNTNLVQFYTVGLRLLPGCRYVVDLV